MFIVSLLILIQLYPCISSIAEENKCIQYYLSNTLVLLIAGIMILFFIITLVKNNNWVKKLGYYFAEFLILIFTIYGVILIQSVLERPNPFLELFILSILALIFIILTILLDFRGLFVSQGE